MELKIIDQNGVQIARVMSQEQVITDVQSALDLIANVQYQTGCNRFIVDQSAINEAFFDLKTMVAGDILQKFINYGVKLAIVGDFSGYASESLRDFMYESNKGRDLFFVADENEAAGRLSR